MDTNTQPVIGYARKINDPLQLSPRQLHLVLAPHRAQRQMMTALTARLALTGKVRLVDAGNCFDGYGLARQLRQQTSYWQAALERVSVARAFTCYQVETLLTESVSDFSPVLVLNLLDTFYDENVRLTERLRLLEVSLDELRRLCRTASVAVSAGFPTRDQPVELLEILTGAAGQVWSFEEPQPARAVAPILRRLFMGRTLPSVTQVFLKEQEFFLRFRRALRRSDQKALDDLFAAAHKHLAAAAYASHALPFEIFLLSMLLEEHKQVLRMRYLLNPSDAAALEQLEQGDSTAYLDSLTAAVEADNPAPLPVPEKVEFPAASPNPVGPEPQASHPNLIDLHG